MILTNDNPNAPSVGSCIPAWLLDRRRGWPGCAAWPRRPRRPWQPPAPPQRRRRCHPRELGSAAGRKRVWTKCDLRTVHDQVYVQSCRCHPRGLDLKQVENAHGRQMVRWLWAIRLCLPCCHSEHHPATCKPPCVPAMRCLAKWTHCAGESRLHHPSSIAWSTAVIVCP